MKNVVFAGNPGAGKSTLLNTLIGRQVFNSGIALGTGLTTVLNTHTIDDVKFSDTPGLDDVDRKKEAALEIQNGLNQESELILVFVITLEAGRLRPADAATIEVILNGISKSGVDVDLKYSVIINRLSEHVYTRIRNGISDPITYKRLMAMFSNRFGEPKDILMIQEEEELTDKDNALLNCQQRLKRFLSGAPTMVTPQTAKIDWLAYASVFMGVVQFLQGVFNTFQSICKMV